MGRKIKKYKIIYADPPWPETSESMIPVKERRKQGALLDARNHFPVMNETNIIGIGDKLSLIISDNCALFLWTTSRHIPMALRVMEHWGFRFVNVGFTWMKKNKNLGTPFIGLGYYTKHNAEFCLLGVKGTIKPVKFNIPSAVYEEKREAFRKPDTVRYRIEQLFGNVPRLELFARQKIKGWDAWGNEIKNDIEI